MDKSQMAPIPYIGLWSIVLHYKIVGDRAQVAVGCSVRKINNYICIKQAINSGFKL